MKAILLAALVLAAVLAAVPAADARPLPGGEPQCMPVYQETNVGPVKIVRRDSCHAESYVCDRTLGEAATAEDPLDCMR